MARYGAWIFDVDGTLLDSQSELRPRTVAALNALNERGAVLLVATALPQRYARMKLGAAPYLCERGVFLGGGHVLDERTGFSHEITVDGAVAAPVLALLESISPELQIVVQYDDTRHAHRLPIDPRLVATWGYDATARVPYERSAARPLTRIIAWHESLDLSEAYDALVAQLGTQARFYLTNGGHVLQVTAAEATKGRGLLRLLAHLAIDPVTAISFGDSTPDIEMFKVTGVSVAMGNSLPEVQAAATLVAPSSDDDGVAQMIEQLLMA